MGVHCELNLDGSLARLKARLVVNRYSHVWNELSGHLLVGCKADVYADFVSLAVTHH